MLGLETHPQGHISSNKATPPNPSHDSPLTEDQSFKHLNLWGGGGMLIETTIPTSLKFQQLLKVGPLARDHVLET